MADDKDDGLHPGLVKPSTAEKSIAEIIRARIDKLTFSSDVHPNQEDFDRLVRREWETDSDALAAEVEALLGMIKKGRLSSFEFYQAQGFPMNCQSARSGFTPLHMAALVGAREILRLLVKIDHLDYLVRDYKGRLASELAFVHAQDPAVARLLRKKEVEQGKTLGIKVTRRPA
ncbi:MAG: ankyrin repeat domain-containing protein [Lewinella sp.]|nr:ankyrin repeat domain-containing protein [Lewinella sp.]